MTDSEILRSVGLGTLLDNVDNNLIGRRVLKAMAQARKDERTQAGSDIQIACMNGDLPDVCESAGDFITRDSKTVSALTDIVGGGPQNIVLSFIAKSLVIRRCPCS